MLGVFYGTSLIADEVDDKTITYLFTRPIARGAVLVGKYLAYLVVTALVVLPSVMIVFVLVVPLGGSPLAGSFPNLVKDLGILGLGLAVYGAVFAWIGAQIKHPLVIGLVFAFGWEQAILVVPGYLRKFTGGLLPAGARAARHAPGQHPQHAPGGFPRYAVAGRLPVLARRVPGRLPVPGGTGGGASRSTCSRSDQGGPSGPPLRRRGLKPPAYGG